jgi:hypothetical protein
MEFLRNSFFCFFVIVCIFQSTFGASMNGTNVTDISPAPNTAPTSVVPVVTDGVVNVTSSNSTNIGGYQDQENEFLYVNSKVPSFHPNLYALRVTFLSLPLTQGVEGHPKGSHRDSVHNEMISENPQIICLILDFIFH